MSDLSQWSAWEYIKDKSDYKSGLQWRGSLKGYSQKKKSIESCKMGKQNGKICVLR